MNPSLLRSALALSLAATALGASVQTYYLRDLGTISSLYPNSSARGVNDSGQVVGDAYSSSGARAFISGPVGDKLYGLGNLSAATSSFASSVNVLGQVAGGLSFPDLTGHAFLSEPNGGAPRPRHP